jgi:Carboxypeptidase regulatory-like domain
MPRNRFLWLVGLQLLFLPMTLNAQTTTGTVRGYVKDQNGTAIAGATVEARNPTTGVQRSTTTRGDGSYVMPGVVPATYEVSIRQIGFAPQRREVVVQIGATQIIDFTMQAGAVELQAVTVGGDSHLRGRHERDTSADRATADAKPEFS